MTKRATVKVMMFTAAISAALAVVFFALTRKFYLLNEVWEPFFVFFLVMAYQCGIRLIINSSIKDGTSHIFKPESFWFRCHAGEDGMLKLLKVRNWKHDLASYDAELFSEKTVVNTVILQNTCFMELLHELDIIAGLMSLVFLILPGNTTISIVLIIVLNVIFVLLDIRIIALCRYDRFVILAGGEDFRPETKDERSVRVQEERDADRAAKLARAGSTEHLRKRPVQLQAKQTPVQSAAASEEIEVDVSVDEYEAEQDEDHIQRPELETISVSAAMAALKQLSDAASDESDEDALEEEPLTYEELKRKVAFMGLKDALSKNDKDYDADAQHYADELFGSAQPTMFAPLFGSGFEYSYGLSEESSDEEEEI